MRTWNLNNCGCRVRFYDQDTFPDFIQCDVHKSAHKLLAALQSLYAAIPDKEGGALGIACQQARATIAEATATINY